MDIDSQSNLGEASQSSTCALCHGILSSDNDAGDGDLEAISVCGDCKFLLLEDYDTASPDVYRRRRPVSRRRYDSSESMESMFSQQFSQIVTLARQNASNVFERDYSVDGDYAARLGRRSSSRTTPSSSRRWRRVFSDTDSDGFDSVYGESESNASFRRYRAVHGEADAVSYSAYGGESDASLDGQSFLENDNFGNPNGESDLDSDNDIDPMNAGIFQWNSEDDEDDSEWDEADIESFTAAAQPPGSMMSNGGNVYINWRRQLLSAEVVGAFPLSIRDRIRAHTGDLLTSFEESLEQNYVGRSGDYLDARGFEDLLEHLAENESSRRGAPPASVSYINSMPCLTISEDKVDGMACAVCKDSFTVGTVVNQLPCLHLYHPSCILPWLSARNTCPLCRYELPTDDRDYEARKRSEMLDIHQHEFIDDGSLDATFDAVVDEPSRVHRGREPRELADADSVGVAGEIPRNRWLFLAAAAAPIVSVVGISLILWFGNPSSAGRICRSSRVPCRRENNQRWWSFF